MKKFDLSCYKDFQIYFNLFDVLIKNEAKNIETFLESVYISPSSYRRAKVDGNKIGQQIMNDLCKYFQYKYCDETVIEELEELFNKIYFDMYYKDYKNFELYNDMIDKKINENLIIFPILKVMKLFLILNTSKSPRLIIIEDKELYEEIKQYTLFYSGMINELVELLDVSFKEDIDERFLSFNYKNEITFHTLAARCAQLGRYIESIHFCNLAKEKFIKDENFKRVHYINLVLLANYNSLFKFDDAYELEKKQMHSLNSMSNSDIEMAFTKKHFIITCLGLKKFEQILLCLKDDDPLSLTDSTCYLIANYYLNKEIYIKEYTGLLKNSGDDEELISLFKTLNDVLISKDKKKVEELKKFSINKTVIDILKEIKYSASK